MTATNHPPDSPLADNGSPAQTSSHDTPDSSTPADDSTPRKSRIAPPLSVPSSSSPPTTSTTSVIGTYPHLAHYIFNLLSSITPSPPRTGAHHPLSISSSGESDEDSDHDNDRNGAQTDTAQIEQKTPKKSTSNGSAPPDRESIVKRIVGYLDNEDEDAVKDILKPHMGDLAKDDILMDQVCLDCMHRRRDDVEHIPYHGTPTPSRLKGSPASNSMPLRPYTPSRVPSFRSGTPLGRPQSPSFVTRAPGSSTSIPSAIPNASTSNLSRSNTAEIGLSPSTSLNGIASSSLGSSDSPGLSPKMLNAKAASFSPSPRIVSAPATKTSIGSPSDPWKDSPPAPPRTGSPFGSIGPPSMTRTSSNLAIAAPLFSDQSSPFHSPIGTPNRGTIKIVPDPFASPAGLQRTASSNRSLIPDDDDDDEFSPFGSGLPRLHHQQTDNGLNSEARPFEPFGASPNTLHSSSSMDESDYEEPMDDSSAGMTPLDVLSSVFSTVPKIELEDALHRSGYDFEGAMAILVSHPTLPRSGSSTPQRVSSPRPLLGIGNRGAMPIGQHGPRDGYFQQGGRTYSGNMSPGLGGARSPGMGTIRMCRYFLAGECRRSDCRFSHDLDRALCRFWLRGHCAKGPNCEFLHQLPNGLDPSALSSAMAHVELGNDGAARYSPTLSQHGHPPDDYPDLLTTRLGRSGRFDPSRNRFANAVKRVPAPLNMPSVQITGARHMPAGPTRSFSNPSPDTRLSTLAVPRPSQRLKLRPPTLLPTLRTGSATNEQYMNARSTAIRLGHARNACLARAADAFRRGDGAAAKRFSREGKALNERMLNETADAAQSLVRDRTAEVQQAVRERDITWSDDPNDRSYRGRECGGGLGIVLGVASTKIPGGSGLSADERTECLIDLHTLHGNEGADVAANFLAELERETYRGLAYLLVGEEKHVGTQDPLRGASKVRLASSVKQFLAEWGYPWNESAGIICVDPYRI